MSYCSVILNVEVVDGNRIPICLHFNDRFPLNLGRPVHFCFFCHLFWKTAVPISPIECFCSTWQNRISRNCIFSLKCCTLLCQQTHKEHSYCQLETDGSPFIYKMIDYNYAPNMTYKGSIAFYHLLPHTWRLPSLS